MKLYEHSFSGYSMGPASPHRMVFTSVVHFFEAEKYRTVDEVLYLGALNCPTLRELRKYVKRHKDQWRDDWLGIRVRVMVCALVYAYWSNPQTEFWQDTEAGRKALATELESLGFPPKFSAGVVGEFHTLIQNPSYTLLGVDHAPPDIIGKRLNTIHRANGRRWTLNHWLGRHTNWKMNEWAVGQFIPVRYFGAHGQRLIEDSMDAMSGPSSKVYLFEQRGGKSMDKALRFLRAKKAAVEIDFYLATDTQTGKLFAPREPERR